MKSLLLGFLLLAPSITHAKMFRCSYDYNRMQSPQAIRSNFDMIVSHSDLVIIAPGMSNSELTVQAHRDTKSNTFAVARKDMGKLLVGTALFLRTIVLHHENNSFSAELLLDLGTGTKTYSNFYDCVKN